MCRGPVFTALGGADLFVIACCAGAGRISTELVGTCIQFCSQGLRYVFEKDLFVVTLRSERKRGMVHLVQRR